MVKGFSTVKDPKGSLVKNQKGFLIKNPKGSLIKDPKGFLIKSPKVIRTNTNNRFLKYVWAFITEN